MEILHNKEVGKKKTKISELKGLGSEIWKNIDANKYVNSERKWK